MATYSKCPKCGNDLEWGYCEVCDEEIPEGDEIVVEVEAASHPWIVKDQPKPKQLTKAEIAEVLKAKYGEPKKWDGKPIITDDRLYTS